MCHENPDDPVHPMPDLTYRELSTVLGALRYLQSNEDDVDECEMSHFDDVDRLTSDQIDELCERINCYDKSSPPTKRPTSRTSDMTNRYVLANMYESIEQYQKRISDLESELSKVRKEAEADRYSADMVVEFNHALSASIRRYEMVLDQLTKMLSSIVVTEGADRGVILLSDESPTRTSECGTMQVYDHENFSELGDALIAIHDVLDGARLVRKPKAT